MDVRSDLKKWAESKDPQKLQKKRKKADDVMAEAQAAASRYKEDKAAKLFDKAAKLYNDAGFPQEAERARSLAESYAADAKSKERIEQQELPKDARKQMQRSTKTPKIDLPPPRFPTTAKGWGVK